MSYQPVPPARHRSSSAVRSSSRPRSMGFYNTNPYSSSNAYNSSSSSLYSTPYSAASSSYSSPYSANSYASPYTSNYKSPYFSNGYRTPSTNSGYASLTIPAKALSNLNITPSNYKSGLSTRDYMKSSSHRSRRDASLSRGSSFNRDRSMSRSQSVNSGLGSKSISLTSLNSEGYVSGTEKSSRSRLGSTTDVRNENGEIDYKKLYEEAMVENKRLKDKLKKSDDELRDTKQTLEKLSVASKNSISELEKREKRSMERKLSEMEEELKHLENLKSENQRLKDENGALIRVISKLSK